MAWYPDGAVGAVSGAEGAADVLYGAGFQFHPYDRMFVLPAAYSDREQITRIHLASQRLDRLGIGVVVRPLLTSNPARPAALGPGAPVRSR
ncbi:hypothetical protein ACFRJ1_02515 [Streptomyces sp. NPDC056773]|uniref:hypothetical protein n=1 Tax=unclassified Streptomyces TaxID=2593676 RepID=UPI0036AEAEA9